MNRTFDRRRVLGAAFGAGLALTGSRLATAQGTPAATPAASPVAGAIALGPARLMAMLTATPAHALTATGVIWADLASAWKLAGVKPLRPGDTKVGADRIRVLQSLATPAHTFEYALLPEYRKTFGFSPFEIEQGLQVGDPPNIITLLRGSWQRAALVNAWTASKYQETSTPAGTVWSWADGPKLDVKDPVSRFGLGGMNNAAFLPDGTVVFASAIKTVELVLRTAAGAEASLAGDARIAGLAASAPAELVSAVILPGASLQQQGVMAAAGVTSPGAVATAVAQRSATEEAAVGTMPRPSFGLLGVTGGTGPHIVARLAVKDAAAADQAAKVISWRAGHATSTVTGQPYSDLLTLVSAAGQADPPVAKADFAPVQPAYANLWIKMIYTRDLGLVGW